MASADTYLKRLVVILSVVLVSLLAIISIYSLLPNSDDEPDPIIEGGERAGPTQAYPGQIFEIDDMEFPLSIGCRSGLDEEGVFLAYIWNRGQVSASYILAASLTTPDGDSVEAIAEINNLAPGEEREAVLRPRESLAGVNACSIVAVQGDRRILLGR